MATQCEQNLSVIILGNCQIYNDQHHLKWRTSTRQPFFILISLQSLDLFILVRFDQDFPNDDNVDSDHVNSVLLAFGQDDIINWCHFGDDNFIPPSTGLHHSVIEHSTDDKLGVNSEFTKNISMNMTWAKVCSMSSKPKTGPKWTQKENIPKQRKYKYYTSLK